VGRSAGAIGLLMWGRHLRASIRLQDRWGGLTVTLILATFGLAFGFPLGIVVALGPPVPRCPRSARLRALCPELIRGVPMIRLLSWQGA